MDARNIGYWLQRIYHDLAGSTMVYMDARKDEYWLQQIYKELTGIDLVGDQRSFDWWSEAIYRHIIGDSGTVRGTVPANVSWQLIYASRASASYPDGSSALDVAFWIQQAQRVGLESSTPAFDPNTVPGLSYWLDVPALGLANNDPIPVLIDSSPAGNDLPVAGALVEAVYKTNIQNSLPAALFSGATYAALFGAPLAQPNTIFIVGRINAVISYLIDGVAAGNRHAILSAGLNQLSLFAGAQIDGAYVQGAWGVFTFLVNGASSEMWLNSVSIASGNAGAHSLTGLTVGSRFTGIENFLDGYIGEILLYNANVSASNRALIEAYLLDRWGLP